MALQDDLTALADFGLFNEGAVSRLANVIRAFGNATAGRGARGRPRGAGKRAPRGSFSPSKDELAKMKDTMTAKEIAVKSGVSVATVNARLRQHGLTKPRKKGKK